MKKIISRFDLAASSYDDSASLQARVADQLVAQAAETAQAPQNILDLGCGTGFVAAAAQRRWKDARITAFDASPAMLARAQRKLPGLEIISGDAAHADFPPVFDLILSSMMLQWLPEPRKALARWRGWLKSRGSLYVALPVAGSFPEWRELCKAHGHADGLWPLPSPDFADDLAASPTLEPTIMTYPSAQMFLKRLKASGAGTARPGHKSFAPGALRRMLAAAPRPFSVTYQILYVKLFARDRA